MPFFISRAILGLSLGASINGQNVSDIVSVTNWWVVPTLEEDSCCDEHFIFRHNKPFRLVTDAIVVTKCHLYW